MTILLGIVADGRYYQRPFGAFVLSCGVAIHSVHDAIEVPEARIYLSDDYLDIFAVYPAD